MSPPSPTVARVLTRHLRGGMAIGDLLTTTFDHQHSARLAGGSPEEQILRQRLDRIAVLARRMVENARVRPQVPVSGVVAELVRIVDEAEG
jgi:hypothetical protein